MASTQTAADLAMIEAMGVYSPYCRHSYSYEAQALRSPHTGAARALFLTAARHWRVRATEQGMVMRSFGKPDGAAAREVLKAKTFARAALAHARGSAQ